MKIWKLSNPTDDMYAMATRVGGTWQGEEYVRRHGRLTIEWEPGSSVVGDFTWPGIVTDIVVSDRVRREFEMNQVPGIEFLAVDVDEPRRKSVKAPEPAGPLWDFWVTRWTPADVQSSSLSIEKGSDGQVRHHVHGVEDKRSRWDPETKSLIMTHKPREAGKGIIVHDVEGVFRIHEFPAWIFCTNSVKQLIEDKSFTNIDFLEMGDVI